MPIVTDSQDYGDSLIESLSYYGARHVSSIKVGQAKTQTGYRSRDLTPQQRAAIDGSEKATWKDSLKIIQGYDYEYNSRPDRIADLVNRRDFQMTEAVADSQAWYSRTMGSTGIPRESRGLFGVRLEAFVSTSSPLWVSETTAGREASSLMRQSVPTAPAVDLVRSIGELRDAPRMFRAANLAPTNVREVGAAYLNYVFGVKPTASDLASTADAVLRSDPIVRGFVANERRRLRRSRTRVTGSMHKNFSLAPGSYSDVVNRTLRGDSAELLGSVVIYDPPWNYQSGSSLMGCTHELLVDASATAQVRQFATYEYFIPRPTNLMDRMDLYRRKAEQVVGEGASPSALWEWTRWSWLVDWFVDIGGLLRYQQAVAANSVVATRNGWTQSLDIALKLTMSPREGYSSTGSLALVASAKVEKRRKGGPYDILKGWDLSGPQAAIVTALAASRYAPF